MNPSKQKVRDKAVELGIDRIGFCDWPSLEAGAPEAVKGAVRWA